MFKLHPITTNYLYLGAAYYKDVVRRDLRTHIPLADAPDALG